MACGVWHTAAIVADPEGSPYAAHLLALQGSPLRVDGGEAGGGDGGGHSPMHHTPQHNRNNSTSSAFSEVGVRRGGWCLGQLSSQWGWGACAPPPHRLTSSAFFEAGGWAGWRCLFLDWG